MHVCICLAQQTHATLTIRWHDTSTRQYLTQSENSSSSSSIDSSSFSLSRLFDDCSILVFNFNTIWRRSKVFNVREEIETTTMQKKIETRVLERIKSRVKNESRTKKSLEIRLCSWLIIFCSNCRLRIIFRTSTSSKSSKFSSKIDSKSNVTTKSISKAADWIKIESTTKSEMN
jgi:hypothetical protein